MTKSTTILEQGNAGDHDYVIAEVDITSLAAIGNEPFDPTTQFGFNVVRGADILDRENKRYSIDWDKDNNDIVVTHQGPKHKTFGQDPGSQTYTGSSETSLGSDSIGNTGGLIPYRFDPANPSDADLSIILRVTYRSGTTDDLADVADGTVQTQQDLLNSVGTDDVIEAVELIVNNTGTDVTEDIGNSTVEYWSVNGDVTNGTDVGTVTIRFEGNFGP